MAWKGAWSGLEKSDPGSQVHDPRLEARVLAEELMMTRPPAMEQYMNNYYIK